MVVLDNYILVYHEAGCQLAQLTLGGVFNYKPITCNIIRSMSGALNIKRGETVMILVWHLESLQKQKVV